MTNLDAEGKPNKRTVWFIDVLKYLAYFVLWVYSTVTVQTLNRCDKNYKILELLGFFDYMFALCVLIVV